MAKDRRQLSREQIREYLKKSDEEGKLDASDVEDKSLKQLAKSQEKGPKKKKRNPLGKTIATRMTAVTGNFTGTIAGTLRSEFESNEFKNRVRALGLGVSVAAIVFVLLSIAPVEFIEKPIHDAKMKLRPFAPAETATFMHLDIDDKSIAAVGRWPWDRQKWAKMIYGAKAAGIDQVVFDVEFYDPQSPTIDEAKLRLLEEEFHGSSIPADRLAEIYIHHDKLLAKAIRDTGNVYLPMHFNRDGNEFRKSSRTIAWNEEVFTELSQRIDTELESRTLSKIQPSDVAGFLSGLTAGDISISEEQAAKIAADELTSIESLYLYRRFHKWYQDNPDSLKPHMDEWLKDSDAAHEARFNDVMAGFREGSENLGRWRKPIYDQLHRVYSYYRMIDSESFGDTAWVLPVTALEGYDPEDYDAWQVADHGGGQGVPFFNDFEFRPGLFQLVAPCRGVGFVSIDPDSDGTIREVPLCALYRNSATGEDHLILQLSFFTLLRECNADFSSVKMSLGESVTFRADPERMSHLQDTEKVNVPEADEDGLAEFSIRINKNGAMTINWAGDPSRTYGDIFGHVPLSNVIEAGQKIEDIENFEADASRQFSKQWHKITDQIDYDSEVQSIRTLIINKTRVSDGKGKTLPLVNALGLVGTRFYGKLDSEFALLPQADRNGLAQIVREAVVGAWLKDPTWWTTPEKERKSRAKTELTTIVPAIAEAFKRAYPIYAANPEVVSLFDPKKNPWKSSLSGLRGLLATPVAGSLLDDPETLRAWVNSENAELAQSRKRLLIERSLAQSVNQTLAFNPSAETLDGAPEEALALFSGPKQIDEAINSIGDFSATREATTSALKAAGIDEKAIFDGVKGQAIFDFLNSLLDQRTQMQESYAAQVKDAGGKRAALAEDIAKLEPVLKGKLGLVGAAATGLGDIRPTPLHENYPGPGIHSNAFNTIVHGEELHDSPSMSLFLGIIFALVICVAASRFNVQWGIISFVGLSLAYLGLDVFLQSAHRSFMDTSRNVSALFLPFLSIQVYRYAVEYRAKMKIKGQFAKFLSPQAVEQIQKNPDALKLGGDEAEMCVYFSDIAGFTPISESMSAPRLIDWLNEYMTRMCEPIRTSDGYVDKFIGDAVMAFWGKPNPCTDYSARGCKAAIEVKQELKRWNKESIERGIPEAGTRIGLASGPFVAGNMGTEWKINFTAIGDTVNLGARLEGANKQYGTQIMINELCYQQAKDVILAHPLDVIAVKGKKQGLPVYHLISTTDIAEPDHIQGAQVYTEAFEAYQRQEWKLAWEGFRDSKELLPAPYLVPYGPYDVMMERCKSIMDATMEERMEILHLDSIDAEWDGVFRMTSK